VGDGAASLVEPDPRLPDKLRCGQRRGERLANRGRTLDPYTDGNNGSADNGRRNEQLQDGNATLIGYRDSRIAIVKWSGGPHVVWARQSLAPSSGTGSSTRS
jgi:hypothetical protein